MNRKLILILPIVFLIFLAVLLAKGLQSDPRKLDSTRVGKPAPAIELTTLDGKQFNSQSMQGKVWLLNVFASWCSACVIEHPKLMQLAQQHRLPLVGLAYKDKTSDTVTWLKQHGGNPYDIIAVDLDGRVGIEYGVYGVPETFVIDGEGKVRMRHAGPVDDEFIAQHVEPLLLAASAGGAK
jgi:cytochrome c biogenesis protein CcmG/thiol:disulfide interchange protein DsbE